jgi:regulator of RNase E activity RraB
MLTTCGNKEGAYRMAEDWNLFERNEGNEPMMIFMNTGLKETAPLAGFSRLIAVIFNMYSLWDAAGNSSKGAQDLFYSLEDKLMRRMQDSKLAVYVGRISVQNKMELIFYADESEDWEPKLSEIMIDFPSFRYYTSVKEDADWSFYREEMYPRPLEEQWMRNAKISYALNQHGDRADIVRVVEHWLHFTSKNGMDEVKGKARELGYDVVNAEKDTSKKMYPYVLQLSKRHALDLPTINEVTKELFILTDKAGGVYDGWGTKLKLKLPAKLRFAWIKFFKKRWYLILFLVILIVLSIGFRL